jgi:PAS domain-containing protein
LIVGLIEGTAHLALISIEGQRSREELTTALDEMKRSEHQLRTIIDTIRTLARRGDRDGSIEFLNQRWCEYRQAG